MSASMQPASYTLRIVGPMTAGEFAPVLSRVNEVHPRAKLEWNGDATECSFVSATPQQNLEARVQRALEAELGPSWRERIDAIAA
jgi:hypothetical protein